MTITIDTHDIDKPDVFVVNNIVGTRFGEPTTGFPTADTLIICTGTAAFDFGPGDGLGFGGVDRETLQFFIPDENGNPLNLDVIYPLAKLFHEATVASLASITGGSGPWAVDRVEVSQVGSLLQLSADLGIGKHSSVLRMAYQANILIARPGDLGGPTT